MTSVGKLHKESGQTGHFGETFLALGGLFLILGLSIVGSAFYVFSAWNTPSDTVEVDAIQSGLLFAVAGIGFTTFGGMAIMSGWGRHHPKFDAGGDPDVDDTYDADGRAT
jgi:hypothetical protein